jgi:hypothetical protein
MSNDSIIRRHHLTETVHNLEQGVYKRHQQVIRRTHICAVLMQEGVSAEDAQLLPEGVIAGITVGDRTHIATLTFHKSIHKHRGHFRSGGRHQTSELG